MPGALADFFFIAGLEGYEPVILNAGGHYISLTVRDDIKKDTSLAKGAIKEESVSRFNANINIHRRTTISNDEGPTPSSSAAYHSRPRLSSSVSESSSERETNSDLFEDVMAKFNSERDEFLSRLTPPLVPVTPPPWQSMASEDHPSTQNNVDDAATSPLRRRSTRRTKLTDVSRRTSRAGNLRRANTIVSRSLNGSSEMYNAVIPTPEPIILAPGTHPLKRKLAPRLLGIWPTSSMTEEIKQRGNAPDYLPMFAFPNDIQVRLSDERPRSTWHGFTMTKANGDRVHVCCVTIWHPVPSSMATELEKQSTEWRKGNLSSEEQELAEALSSKLANERVILSLLHNQLPSLAGSRRDEINDQILLAEEKISLYAELLKPIRLHAAARVEGLTEGQGMWLPRCYGLLGREDGFQTIWREWLRAVAVPWVSGEVDIDIVNTLGAKFLPLERYVVNICGEVPAPISGKNQVEVAVRELRLYAMKEDVNELPGWRDVDLYPLFRALSLKHIIILFEAAISEARIIFRSSYPAMLYSAARALIHLLWPFKFSGVFIPVLPSRLLSCLEAPISYIIGIDRAYERLELPEDDFLLCDLDQDSIVFSAAPMPLPPNIRQKLAHLLSLSARFRLNRGVSVGPPNYVRECYPKNCFIIDRTVISSKPRPPDYGRFVGLRSMSFGDTSRDARVNPPVFNAFAHSIKQEERDLQEFLGGHSRNGKVGSVRSISSSDLGRQTPSRQSISSSNTLREAATSLRHQGSRGNGMWRSSFRRSTDKSIYSSSVNTPSSAHFPRNGFSDTSSVSGNGRPISPSSTGRSTILNFDALTLPVRNVEESEKHQWREGHSLRWRKIPNFPDCDICFGICDKGEFVCDDCQLTVHHRCLDAVTLPCPSSENFSPDRIRAAFLRCFASLLFDYRRYIELIPPGLPKPSDGRSFHFKLGGFLRNAPKDAIPFLEMLSETQAFSEFIMERCTKPANVPEIALFDQIIMAKRNRGRRGLFGRQGTPLLLNSSVGNLETRKTIPANDTQLPPLFQLPHTPPLKLDSKLLLPPRLAQPRSKYSREKGFARRKPVNKSDETINSFRENEKNLI